jgi:predicted AlkP superfamily phosphohydrolase/phosphomutase
MANVPKKVAVIGLDCAEPHLILKHIEEGHLPNFKKLIEGGVLADNCLVPYPTVTPPNWASIATGSWPGTHQITDFHVHLKGTTPINPNTVQAFSSERCQAEYIWDALDNAGKKCIVFNYPGAWPSHMKNGIMVGGAGLSVGENRDGIPGLKSSVLGYLDQLLTTGIYARAVRSTFKPAKGWKNLPAKEDDPLEFEATLEMTGAMEGLTQPVWYVLARQSGKNGYDRVTLSPTRDIKDAFCTIAAGEWSPVINTKVKMKDGTEIEADFRCKLLELSDDAEDFRLYISQIGFKSGWSNPPEIAAEISSQKGHTLNAGGILGLVLQWYEMDTFLELNDFYTGWLADVASTLMSKHEWDLFYMHAHSPDWAYHMILTEMDENVNKDAAKRKEAWDAHLKIYQMQDKMIERIMQVCDKDTMFVLVSDHGAVADGTPFDLFKPLVAAGLTVLHEKQDAFTFLPLPESGEVTRFVGEVEMFKSMAQTPDVNKSKCFPQRELYVYINLKGRDPEGIVDPKDYEAVQQQIIDALITYVDPKTGKRPVALALTKKDARILGLYGDGVGDVIFAVYPWIAGQHGNILPAAEWGVGSLKGLLTFTGPGIKKGYRLERTSNLIDLVPTICYMMDWPMPATVDGAVLFQVLKDPDIKVKEVRKLKEGLARMETALQRGERQPWDKHECA